MLGNNLCVFWITANQLKCQVGLVGTYGQAIFVRGTYLNSIRIHSDRDQVALEGLDDPV
jgi:hypothetical protein